MLTKTFRWWHWDCKHGLVRRLVISQTIALVGYLVSTLSGNCALAQTNIVPDNTLGEENSTVTPEVIRGIESERIDGGAQRGANLFHSFENFNIDEGRGAYFTNPAGIENILSRVTGTDASEILGTLGVLGNANLFLINPNGIIFGPNASLDVVGSFVGTTANAIQFGDQGFFSATEPDAPPLLTVQPSALFFNQINSGRIEQQSTATALQVPEGQSLLLVGGDIVIDGGKLGAIGSRIELGGLEEAGTVGLNTDGNNLNLNFPESVTKADVSLNNAEVSGSITINARNLEVLGTSLLSGSLPNLSSDNSQVSNIEINATDKVTIAGADTAILNLGSGDIVINTGSLNLNEATIISTRLGEGNPGNIKINATDSVFVSKSSLLGTYLTLPGQENSVDITVNGNTIPFGFEVIPGFKVSFGGGVSIIINTQNLELLEGSILQSGSLPNSSSDNSQAGNIEINATDKVTISGVSTIANISSLLNTSNLELGSTILNLGGNIVINTGSFNISKAGIISTTLIEGNSGNIQINATDSISINDSSFLGTSNLVEGNSGDIIIKAGDTISLEGQSTIVSVGGSALSSLFSGDSRGKGGAITIEARSLFLTNQAFLTSGTLGQEDAGSITIKTSDSIALDNSFISSSVGSPLSEGNAAEINIQTQTLSLTNGAEITSSTFGIGNAGKIQINASDSVNISGISETAIDDSSFFNLFGVDLSEIFGFEVNSPGYSSGLFTSTNPTASGQGGEIIVTTDDLRIAEGAEVTARSQGNGNAGNIIIEASNTLNANDGDITSSADQSTGGAINITAGDIRLRGDSKIRTNVFQGAGGGGNINLEADSIIAFDDSDILAFSRDGRGGNITLDTPAFFGESFRPDTSDFNPDLLDDLDNNDSVDINASGATSGVITLPDVSFIQNSLTELPENPIDTTSLLATSCIVPGDRPQNSFTITGSGGLPTRPEDAFVSSFPIGTIQTIPPEGESEPNSTAGSGWQEDDAIVEPTGVYRLPNGQLILSRECS